MSAQAETTGKLAVRKLHPALGAEVRGVDMRQPLDAATFEALHDIWMEHQRCDRGHGRRHFEAVDR